jgi:hypothetical protein
MVYKLKNFTLIFLIILNSCGYYSFKGALPSHIKTVAVPLFENNTEYPNVREDLTNMIVDEFISDNSLSITDESNADIIITGVITSITQRAASVVSGEQVEEYHVYVNVKVKCEDVKNNKALWERTINEYGTMDANTADDTEREAAILAAMEKITEDILNNTLGYW